MMSVMDERGVCEGGKSRISAMDERGCVKEGNQ